ATLLAWTATVVWDRRNITDRGDQEASSLQSAKCRFTARTWTANFNLKRLHAVFLSLLCAIFSSDLSSKWSRLTRTLEALCTSRRPSNSIALCVSDCDHCVVEGRVDMRNTRRDIFTFATANTCGFFGHFIPFLDLFTAVTPAATPVTNSLAN